MGRYFTDTTLVGLLQSGETVTIEIWKLENGGSEHPPVMLNSNVCYEIDATGMYTFNTCLFTNPPTSETEYVYKMTSSFNAADVYYAKFSLKAKFIDPDECPIMKLLPFVC